VLAGNRFHATKHFNFGGKKIVIQCGLKLAPTPISASIQLATVPSTKKEKSL
jgi:hypothetical protein